MQAEDALVEYTKWKHYFQIALNALAIRSSADVSLQDIVERAANLATIALKRSNEELAVAKKRYQG